MSVFDSTVSPLLPQLHHASSFPLCSRVPAELIHEITPHISAKDLASLALVDRECRALVRCVQFKDVSLVFDASEDAEKRNAELLDVMGGYIRRLRVLVASKEGTKGLDLQLVERTHALPNLMILDMSVKETISLDSLVGLMASSAQHLRLVCQGLTIGERADGELPPSSLETFCLTLPSSSLLPFLPVLDNIAQSVRSVELNILPSSRSDANELPFRSGFPRYPDLKQLSLTGPPPLHLLSVKSSAPYLTTLCVPPAFLSLLEDPLLPTLEVLSIPQDSSPPSDDDLESLSDFLSTNDQLTAVEISLPLSARWITTTLLPLLASTPLAKSLRRLKLIWQTCSELEHFLDDTFSILRALALTSLTVGSAAPWRPNHDLIIDILTNGTKLGQSLQRLAFVGDSYLPVEERHPLAPPQHHWQQNDMMIPEYYLKPFPRGVNFESYLTPAELHSLLYSSYFPNCGSRQDYGYIAGTESPSLLRLYNLAWERYHQEKMKELAKRYRAALCGLSQFCAGKVCVWFNGDAIDGLDEFLDA